MKPPALFQSLPCNLLPDQCSQGHWPWPEGGTPYLLPGSPTESHLPVPTQLRLLPLPLTSITCSAEFLLGIFKQFQLFGGRSETDSQEGFARRGGRRGDPFKMGQPLSCLFCNQEPQPCPTPTASVLRKYQIQTSKPLSQQGLLLPCPPLTSPPSKLLHILQGLGQVSDTLRLSSSLCYPCLFRRPPLLLERGL